MSETIIVNSFLYSFYFSFWEETYIEPLSPFASVLKIDRACIYLWMDLNGENSSSVELLYLYNRERKKQQNQVKQVAVIQHIFLAKMVWGANAASITGSKK